MKKKRRELLECADRIMHSNINFFNDLWEELTRKIAQGGEKEERYRQLKDELRKIKPELVYQHDALNKLMEK